MVKSSRLLQNLPTYDEEQKKAGDILNSVPKIFYNKARIFLNTLKKDGGIRWNEKGVVCVDNKLVPNSNIIDLTNDILRHRKIAPDPIGWQSFARAVISVNMPFEIIGNWNRRTFIASANHSSPSSLSPDKNPSSKKMISKHSRSQRKKIFSNNSGLNSSVSSLDVNTPSSLKHR